MPDEDALANTNAACPKFQLYCKRCPRPTLWLMSSQGVRISVATKPVDLRKGHDGLVALIPSELEVDPFTGMGCVFQAKRADRMTILFRDGSELVTACKRLEERAFPWPAIRDGIITLSRAQIEALQAVHDYCAPKTP